MLVSLDVWTPPILTKDDAQALTTVVEECYLRGVSIRRMDKLV